MRYKVFLFIMIMFFAVTVNAEGEATIKNIKVNGTTCTCSGYECNVDVIASNATITYELVDKDATVDRLSGFKIDLLSEITTIKLTVSNTVNDEKIENIYNITINKKEQENNLNLKSLKVNGTSISVLDDVVVYSYTASYDTKAITIEAVPVDSTAKIIKQDSYDFPLEDGSISVDFAVKPTNGEQLDYRVVVTREQKPNTTLKSLKIEGVNLKFDENTFEYEFNVDYSINELVIDAVANNQEAKIDIENKSLVVGENEVKITITNGKEKSEYLLKVTREENVDKSVANLKELTIAEYKRLDFKENVLDYTLKFSSIPEKLTIKAIAKDNSAEIEIDGNSELTDGSEIVIAVKLNNITREYTLLVKESKNVSDNKNVILIAIIVLSLTIVALIIIEIHSKKQEKKKYLKKIFDLRHKIERKRKAEKENKNKEEKETKLKLRIKPREKKEEAKVDDDGIEII